VSSKTPELEVLLCLSLRVRLLPSLNRRFPLFK
jgi:hypothetical protein